MNIFKKIKEKWYEGINLFRQIALDRKNRKIFLDTIREETADPESDFVKKWNLKLGDDGESLIYLTSVPENFQSSGRDFMIQDKLNENTYFVTEFLKKICQGGEYISLPEYYHIEDPSSSEISLMYLAVWHFSPIIYPSLKYKAIGGLVVGSTLLIGGLVWLLIALL